MPQRTSSSTEDPSSTVLKPHDIEASPAAKQRSYTSFAYQKLDDYLTQANESGKIGSGPAETAPQSITFLASIWQSMPYRMLIVQAIWAALVMTLTYVRAEKGSTTLSDTFWTSSFLVSSSVVYGIGWALFVLLGFFIREASKRHREALQDWHAMVAQIRAIVRMVAQLYPKHTWHDDDHDRLLAHLIAYPIALKMMLRNEREREPLLRILHPLDVDDVIHSKDMHIHCLRVVRSYLTCAESDAHAGFKPAVWETPAGSGSRFNAVPLIDQVDLISDDIIRISDFHPALGYSNHLRIFLYTWFFFLPLALVETSGWFTVLWAVLITYGIGMLFVIAQALNDPFGFDLQDIKLNRMASEAARSTLRTFLLEERRLTELIKPEHNTPNWLEVKKQPVTHPTPPSGFLSFLLRTLKSIRLPNRQVIFRMAGFLLWLTFIVLLTFFVADDDEPGDSCRWWCLYIPVTRSTTSYIGLGIFLLLGFWVNDAYGRYWSGLQLWQTPLKIFMSRLLFQLGFSCRAGTWHERDIERLFSHIAAIPYAGKLKLRDSRDLSDFEGLLAPEDIAAMAESEDIMAYCFRVVFAYVNSLDKRDKDTLGSGKRPVKTNISVLLGWIAKIENVLIQCDTMRKVPISPSFTQHLQLFAVLWLLLIPLAFVEHNGFFSYLYLLPIAYSIVRLLIMGDELADPFGYDENDIPLDTFCAELKDMVHEIYEGSTSGPESIILESDYAARFIKPGSEDLPAVEEVEQQSHVTFKGLLSSLRQFFPTVSWIAQLSITLWAVAAVFISYGLSYVWDRENQNVNCREWCSPIDVDRNILVETGFALFLILSFRASDAMNRYQKGASLLDELQTQLRSFAVEITQAYEDGVWHKNDKERILAHLIHIPLFLRDFLLGYEPSAHEGILSKDDFEKCMSHADRIRHCIHVVDAYIMALDIPSTEIDYVPEKPKPRPAITLLFTFYGRTYKVLDLVEQMKSIKRFPVVSSYTGHQRLFTAIWLILLPLGMTAWAGFYTILWAPLISYGILALEALATSLVDPFGHDDLDLPVAETCKRASAQVLDAVRSTRWDYRYHLSESPADHEAHIGSNFDGETVRDGYKLAKFSDDEVGAADFGATPIMEFAGPTIPMTKPNFLAHIMRSVPWWVLLMVSVWSALGVVISYVARESEEKVRWWTSRIFVDDVVATYIGFPAFMLLGFFVQEAFGRYQEAGTVWGDDLRAACHSLAVHWYLTSKPGTWHKGDHDRVMGHLAALPVALKAELRDERDLRELKGLLSQKDIGRLLTADSMSTYCMDVIRTYYFAGISRPESLMEPVQSLAGNRKAFTKHELAALDEAVRKCKLLKSFPIAPSFIILLRTLMGIWFIFLPFVLAESSGWFAILWIPIIAYGLLGMYAVASELQEPFGRDLNDLDLDKMAARVVREVLFVQRNYRNGVSNLVLPNIEYSGEAWIQANEEDMVGRLLSTVLSEDEKGGIESWKDIFCMAIHAVPLWILLTTAVITAGIVVLAWVVSEYWTLDVDCSPAFCSRIAVNGVVKEYIGFALFLLLGTRLYDSHARYVSALTAWRDGILGLSKVISNRMFEAFPSGTFHAGDSERIAAHLAAFSVVTVSKLRRERSSAAHLQKIMGAADVARVEGIEEKGDYCLDVIRGYLVYADMHLSGADSTTFSDSVHWMMFYYLNQLKNHAAFCERMISVPMPFGYVQHIYIFMVIYLVTLPLGLVETSGWWSILWVSIVAYGVIGIEKWSAELANPFGKDLSDLPLGRFRLECVTAVQRNLKWFYRGNESVIHPERKAFATETKDIDESGVLSVSDV